MSDLMKAFWLKVLDELEEQYSAYVLYSGSSLCSSQGIRAYERYQALLGVVNAGKEAGFLPECFIPVGTRKEVSK